MNNFKTKYCPVCSKCIDADFCINFSASAAESGERVVSNVGLFAPGHNNSSYLHGKNVAGLSLADRQVFSFVKKELCVFIGIVFKELVV